MADRVEILMRARGGAQIAAQTGMASKGMTGMARSATLANRSAGRLGGGLRSLSKWGGRAALAVGGTAVLEIKRGTDAWEGHRKTVADVRQALKTTDGAANVSAAHLSKRADAMQRVAAVDDDVVLSGERVLLTFLKVQNRVGKGNKVFDRATSLAVDMAARFGTDTRGAFVQLGKALDDPVKGITALRRSGVSFTQAERDKIKTLEDTGHHLQAQKIILAALDKQVGGSAKAQATPLAKLKQSWGDLEKELGRNLSPTVDTVTKKLGHLTDDATRIMGRKDLTWQAKVKLFARKDLKPEVDNLIAGLKAAHLGAKLEGAIEWAIPKMADGFATAAPHAARAFVKGFQGAGTWGKLITAGFLLKKLGGFGAMGKLLAGGFGRGLGGGAAGFVKGPVPVFVVNKGGLPGGEPVGGKPGKITRFVGGSTVARLLAGSATTAGAAGVIKLGTDAYMAGGKTSYQRKQRLGESVDTALKRPLGMPPARGASRDGKIVVLTDKLGHAIAKFDRRLDNFPDSHPVSRSTRLDRYPDSHVNPKLIASSVGTAARNATKDLPGKTGRAVREGTKALPARAGKAVRDGTRHLDRLPERVAGAVARRPNNVRIHNVIQMPDGRVLAEIVTDYPDLLSGAIGGQQSRNQERG